MEERVYQGNVYRRNGPGESWVLVGPSRQSVPAPSGIVIGRPNVREEERKDAGVAVQEGQLGVAQGNLDVRRATLPAEIAKAQAEARKAQIEADRAASEAQKAPSPQTGMIQQQLQTDSVLQLLQKARAQVGQGYNTGNVFGSDAFKSLPVVGQGATDLDTTLTGIGGNVIKDVLAQLKAQSSTGASGFGSLTEREGQLLQASIAALSQKQSAGSLLENLARVERHYRNALALINKEDPRQQSVQEKYGIVDQFDRDKPIPGVTPGGKVTSSGNTENDPVLRGVNSAVSRMVQQGRRPDEIRSYLNAIRPGMGDAATGIDEAVAYFSQHPETQPRVDLEKVWRPQDSTLGDIGMTPLGSGVIGAADALTMGTLDNMTANPEVARAAMEGVSNENPWSYTLGQIGGGAATGLGLEAGLARAGLTGLAGIRAGEALYGAGYGAGASDQPDDSRLSGGFLGAGSGLLGGMLGRTASRVGGTALGGVTDEVVQALNNAGVRMTPGQVLRGGTLQRTEDRLAGLPIVGDQIRARRIEGLEDFNRAAFEEAVDPINGPTNGVIAEPGVEILRSLRSQAYDNALDPVRVTADPQFVSDLGATIGSAQRLPETMANNAEWSLRTRIGEAIDPNGMFTGRDYQQMLRGLRRDASSFENQPFGYDFGQVTRQAEGALEGVLQRQSPGVVEALRTANEVNRNVETIRTAVNAARNGSRTGNPGVFAPSQLSDAAAASAKKYGNSQGTTNQPFYDLTRAGQTVLPSSVPDSGTAGRAAIAAALLGGAGGYSASEGETADRASTGAGTALVAALLAAAPYSPAARGIFQRALLAERPRPVRRAGQALVDNDTIAGLLAAPALVEYTAGP